MTDELQEIRELRRDVQDLCTAVEGVSFELQKISLIQRTWVTFKLGDDPLNDFYDRFAGIYEDDAPPDTVPREWLSGENGSGNFPRLTEREREGMAAAIVFASVVVSVILVILFLLWVAGGHL